MAVEGVELLRAADSERDQARIAGGLRARGLQAGDRVALLTTSGGRMLSGILGALRAGIIPVVLNSGLLDRERDELLADAEPTLVVDDGLLAELATAAPVELAPVPLGRPMHYTSGTTGRPKGVWSGVLTEAEGAALLAEETESWGFCADDVNLVCSPLHHSAPIRFAGGTLLAGGSVAILHRFEASLAAQAIDAHRPTSAFMVPAHLQRIFALADRGGALPDLSSFRLLAHAGAPCPAPIKERALEAFPAGSVWEFYGSTEGQFTACSGAEWRERPDTVGRARAGRSLATEPDGTIWCSVPGYARFTYWRDPDRTAQAWRGDAFTVGDLGRIDDDGYLYLDGRRNDLIISGGVNVYPVEVEHELEDLPGLVEVAVFGVPDERWGQRVCAAVVGDVDPAAVQARAAERLAAYKRPKQVFTVDELPRTATGKVRRTDLAAQLGLEDPPAGAQPGLSGGL